MLTVAITGSTKGIGKEIKKYFLNKGYQVLEFNSSNGFNIADKSSEIIEASKNVDIFVNNSYCHRIDNPQLVLLKTLAEIWTGQIKTIINISSRYVNDDNLYCKNKKALDQYCENKIYMKTPFIVNLKPGLVNTERVKDIIGPRIETIDVLNILDFVLNSAVPIHSITFGK
jgi:hypothetical protein